MCEHPIVVIPNKTTGQRYLVPCGKCFSCNLQRRSMWSERLCNELATNTKSAFVTLTYDDEHLIDDCLHKKHLQDFFKRFRKVLYEEFDDVKIKYYACGEYGGQFGRPHFHFIIFGVDEIETRYILNKTWQFGFTMVDRCCPKSIRYVAGYVCGKMSPKKWEKKFPHRDKQFQLQSRGIGLKFAQCNKEQIEQNLCFKIGEKRRPIPRYYLNKLFPKALNPDFWFRISQERYNRLYDYAKKAFSTYDDERLTAIVDDYFYCRGDIRQNELFIVKQLQIDVQVENYIKQRNLRKKKFDEFISKKQFTDSDLSFSEYHNISKSSIQNELPSILEKCG